MPNDAAEYIQIESWNIPPNYDARFPYKLQVGIWTDGTIVIDVRDFNGTIKSIEMKADYNSISTNAK